MPSAAVAVKKEEEEPEQEEDKEAPVNTKEIEIDSSIDLSSIMSDG